VRHSRTGSLPAREEQSEPHSSSRALTGSSWMLLLLNCSQRSTRRALQWRRLRPPTGRRRLLRAAFGLQTTCLPKCVCTRWPFGSDARRDSRADRHRSLKPTLKGSSPAALNGGITGVSGGCRQWLARAAGPIVGSLDRVSSARSITKRVCAIHPTDRPDRESTLASYSGRMIDVAMRVVLLPLRARRKPDCLFRVVRCA
jgi:hypothetical protein